MIYNIGLEFTRIWLQYNKPCLGYIEDNQFEECQVLYTDMVHELSGKYILKD